MNYNKYIQEYLDIVDNDIIPVCKEQKLLSKFIKKIFETENLIIDDEKVEKYFSYQKYFPFDLFPWEKFCFVLHNCVFKENGLPRFPDLFILVGRGSGKNAYLGYEDFCLITPTNGIKNYDIDISANSEDQAKTTFMDIYNILEDPKHTKKMKKHFYWNKEEIINLKTKSRIKFRTNNPKGKDGLRSGKVDFDEIHAYQNWENINVFTTGLGKKDHPRRTYITTNGDVRDGPLDNLLEKAMLILNGEIEDNGFLPFICRLDDEEEVHDYNNWAKANPSLPYRPSLMEQMKKEYEDYKINPYVNSAFMTKRMNIPKGSKDIEVTSWENILATNKEIPDLEGASCTIGFDYTKVNDFLTVGLLFLKGGVYYWISHSWFCINSRDKDRIKAPLEEWQEKGLLTIVNDIEINPDIPCEWVQEQLIKYNCIKTGIDNFRLALLSKSLKKIGIDTSDKEQVKIIRPSDIMKIVPVIDSLFNNHQIIWGDNPLMRWFTNNTKLTSKTLGNYVYDKIEPKSRKTDGFMAFVHAMIAAQDTLEDEDNSELFFMPPLVF
ncbi:terminase TerL endonuclease subunit [uncultured Intestinibacter sp.]|jgi:phage terminase large subunit-like protein|uniref:terminase TerL endonuclease subunit n=1 Tax=uncultured Intestinibacter sp. TaxID=1505659 RepID=UPI0027DC80A8|nr:terminase TerL endonuclease subunit [uncultured Intestinibacter sp.]